MKITIDTKHDSADEIREVIEFLKKVVGSGGDVSDEGGQAFGSMFGSDSPSKPPEDDDIPKIEPY